MNTQISIRHMSISESIKQLIRNLCDEVQGIDQRIQEIDVNIEDVNGPHKSGIDKHCHLRVRGREHVVIDVDEIDRDLSYAIDQAFSRLRQELYRLQKIQRRSRVSHHVFTGLEADTTVHDVAFDKV